jgi:WXXGXW repeat (2 copies)
LLIFHGLSHTWTETGIQRFWRTKMKNPPPLTTFFAFMLAVGIFLCGCHGNQQQTPANTAAQADQPSSDPADANLAPVANTSAAPGYQPSPAAAQDYAQQNQYSDEYAGEYSDQDSDSPDESYYGVEPVATAPDPPPPLPDYDQPPCPGDDYIWTPGYWDYASTGYYWVPGVWVQSPYVGALWTPGYWGYSHGHYAFFHGYWGPHIGFYGGVDYGFGYVGVGYQGGYWNGGHFDYNRSVNNVNVTVVHNVYSRTIVNNTTIVNNNRVSYNGGSGGIRLSPRPAELAALREPHAPPMQTQMQVQRAAGANRAQFAAVNHGRPVEVADNHPVAAVRDVRPVAPTNIHNLPVTARPPVVAHNNVVPANRPPENSNAPGRPETNVPQTNRPQPGFEQPNRQQPNPTQASRPEHPQPTHQQAQPQPMRQQQYHPAPAPNVASHAVPNHPEQPQPRPEMQPSRPPETNHPPQASHPAPPSHPVPPAHNPPPQEHKDEHQAH